VLGDYIWEKIAGPTAREMETSLAEFRERLEELGVRDAHAKNIMWCPERRSWVLIDCGSIEKREK